MKTLEAQRRAREAEAAAKREQRTRRHREAAENGSAPSGRPPGDLEVELAEQALAREEARAAQRAARRAEREAAAAAAGRKVLGRPPKAEDARLRRARQRVQRARTNAEDAAENTAKDTGEDTGEEATKNTRDEPRVNVTDPASRVMKTHNGWVQGYNAQAAANEQGLVLAAEATQDINDLCQCEPMMARTRANLDAAGVTEPVEMMLFDAGYLSEHNLTIEGPDRLIATGKAWKLRREEPTEGPPPSDATPIAAMGHRLRTEEGAALYAKRQHTIEPIFGDIKELRGFRRFSRRGLDAVDAEWKLQMTAHNILKMFRQRTIRLA